MAAERPGGTVACVLANQHPAALDAVSHRVSGEEGMRVLAVAADGHGALGAIRAYRPTVALVELELPRLSGIEIARQEGDTTGIVIYAGHRDRVLALEALQVGARGIVFKEAPLDNL